MFESNYPGLLLALEVSWSLRQTRIVDHPDMNPILLMRKSSLREVNWLKVSELISSRGGNPRSPSSTKPGSQRKTLMPMGHIRVIYVNSIIDNYDCPDITCQVKYQWALCTSNSASGIMSHYDSTWKFSSSRIFLIRKFPAKMSS